MGGGRPRPAAVDHCHLADSGALVYRRYVRGLTRTERDAYWRDWLIVGELFGLDRADMPANSAGLRAYMREMLQSDILHVSPEARDLGVEVVLRPPVPLIARPLLELANFTIIGLLPARIRREYRLWWNPARTLLLDVGAESTRPCSCRSFRTDCVSAPRRRPQFSRRDAWTNGVLELAMHEASSLTGNSTGSRRDPTQPAMSIRGIHDSPATRDAFYPRVSIAAANPWRSSEPPAATIRSYRFERCAEQRLGH